jgi:hypothetical protein
MSIEERESEFKQKASAVLSINAHVSPCYGTSNIARMVPGGIVLAVTNLANYTNSSGPLSIISRICPLPTIELYFAAVISSEKQHLVERLSYMISEHSNGNNDYGRENNNTSACLAHDKNLYFYNKKISQISSPPQSLLGAPIKLDNFYYAIYAENSTEDIRLILKRLLNELASFVGLNKFIELDVWGKYDLFPSEIDSYTPSIPTISGELVKDFHEAANLAGASLPPNLVRRFITALATKKFVLLTGLSGSGKTKLAELFASWLGENVNEQMLLVSIGADWTSNENVIGYTDGLNKGRYIMPTSGILDFLLAASLKIHKPYFLILDEMNLSHVERYFSDFLTAIESENAKIRLHRAQNTLMSERQEIPPEISLPSNLFIIGTVNVDETTYMFSPKVLDRANVIEFRPQAEEIQAFLANPKQINFAQIVDQGSEYADYFVNLSNTHKPIDEIFDASGTEIFPQLQKDLLELHQKLESIGAEFGYRTIREITQFFANYNILSKGNFQYHEALDAQVVQKLMPKLHGSARKLSSVLDALMDFATSKHLSLTANKVQRMKDRLQRDGFTSFAEN